MRNTLRPFYFTLLACIFCTVVCVAATSQQPLEQPQNGHMSKIVTGDLDNDQWLEIVVADRELRVLNHDGSMVAGWPVQLDHPAILTPSLSDLDGDGRLEIIVTSSCSLSVFHNDGTLSWCRFFTPGGINTSEIVDMNKDGRMEILMTLSGSTEGSGHIHLWDHKGNAVNGWPHSLGTDQPRLANHAAPEDTTPPTICFETSNRQLQVDLGDGIGGPGDERLDVWVSDNVTSAQDMIVKIYFKGLYESSWTLTKTMTYIRELHRGSLSIAEVLWYYANGHTTLLYKVTAEDAAGNVSTLPVFSTPLQYSITIND